MKIKPTVSTILATKNEEQNISRCINSLKDQTYENMEIILVDNNSSDDTVKIASNLIEKVFNLPELTNTKNIKNYRGAQVNYGVTLSTGEIIFFPDADMTFDKNLISEAVDLIQEQAYEALYSPEVIIGSGLFVKARNFERSFYNQTCIDGLRFIRKDLFIKAGGFDEKNIKFGPDDWDLTKTIKKYTNKVSITKNVIYHHERFKNVLAYIKKKIKYTTTLGEYINKWGNNDDDIKKQFGLWYRYIGVFSEDGKWKMLLSRPDLALYMYLLRFMVGFFFLWSEIKRKLQKCMRN